MKRNVTLPRNGMSEGSGRGFTLIELLVVIAIIGILATIVLASLSSSTGKANDAKRISELGELNTAFASYSLGQGGGYTDSVGWIAAGGLNFLAPIYIASIPADPTATPPNAGYMYWRKDYSNSGYPCMTLNDPTKYAFYAKLQYPTAAELATMTDSFDQCVATLWGMNYKIGN